MDRHGVSKPRACELADLHRSVYQYQKQDWSEDALCKRLRDLANERRRFGYRRLVVFANLKRITRPASLELRKGFAQQALTANVSTERNRNGFYT